MVSDVTLRTSLNGVIDMKTMGFVGDSHKEATVIRRIEYERAICTGALTGESVGMSMPGVGVQAGLGGSFLQKITSI